MDYVRLSVPPSQLAKLMATGKFQAVKPELTQGANLLVKAEIPKAVEAPNIGPAFLRVEQGSIATSIGRKSSRIVYNFFWEKCMSSVQCSEAEKEQGEEQSLDLKNWTFLPVGVRISEVLYGDANQDYWTDVLIKLSNGAGILFRHKPDPLQPPPVWK